MKLNKNQIIIGIVLLTILSIFLIIKHSCEKLHQDILMYGDKDVSAVYLVNSKIRKDNLYLDIIGPISKGNVFIDSDINIEIKDNFGAIIGKYLVKDSEIFNTRGKHITFSAIIPNITWKDKLTGFKIDMFLSRKYTDKYCINNDMSNIKLYYKAEKINKNDNKRLKNKKRSNKPNPIVQFFQKIDQKICPTSFVKNALLYKHYDPEDLYGAYSLLKRKNVKNKVQLEEKLGSQGMGDYAKFFKFDKQNNLRMYVEGVEVVPSGLQGKDCLTVKN